MFLFDGEEYLNNPGIQITGVVLISKSAGCTMQMLMHRDGICTRRFANNTWGAWQSYVTNSDIQSGIVDIPANTTSVTVQFKKSFAKDPIVVVTGKFVHKTNIFCTIASVGKDSFSIYPIDSSTNNAPTENSRFNWIAIDI